MKIPRQTQHILNIFFDISETFEVNILHRFAVTVKKKNDIDEDS